MLWHDNQLSAQSLEQMTRCECETNRQA